MYTVTDNRMPKRKRQKDDHVEAIIPRAMMKCKNTKTYQIVFANSNVHDAKTIVRKMGNPKWYSLKKKNLVSFITLDIFARRITKIMRKNINLNYCIDGVSDLIRTLVKTREHPMEDNRERCPITMDYITDIEKGDIFQHGKTYFNAKSLVDYLNDSYDFKNPVTGIQFLRKDIDTLQRQTGCRDLLTTYLSRERNRTSLTNEMNHFIIYERELEENFSQIINVSGTPIFFIVLSESEGIIHQTIRDMFTINEDRAEIVLKSLLSMVKGDPSRPNRIPQYQKNCMYDILTDYIDV